MRTFCHRRVGHDSKQTSLGVFRPLSAVRDRASVLQTGKREQSEVDCSLYRQETQLRVKRTLSASLYTGDVLTRTHKLPLTTESSRSRLVTSYRATEHLRHRLRHTALFYVTNLEYRVIANHLSASGLRLAPHLTHAPSCQQDDRGAGDITLSLGCWPTTAKLAIAWVGGALVLPALIRGPSGL